MLKFSLFFLIELIIKTKMESNPNKPIKIRYEKIEEWGKRRELIPSTFISPKYLPKDIGPVPKINSKKLGLYLTINSPHINALFKKNERTPITPNTKLDILFVCFESDMN